MTSPAPAAGALTETATGPVVEVRALRKSYPGPRGTGRKVAVEDVSFSVDAGEIFGILGPNGAGKTTTVECLAGLRTADGGQVRILGTDPQQHPEAIKDVVGVQLQEAELSPRITVREAMRLFASFYEDPADPDELLALLDLVAQRDVRFSRLSGGQKQRLSIALALVGRPRVAILDELTTGLDPAARRATWDLIERVRDSGVTILLVTHFMDEAERLCDRLVIIDHGRVVAEGTPAELIEQVDAERTVVLRLAAEDVARAVASLDGMPEVSGVAVAGRRVEVTGARRVLFAVVQALAAHDVVPDDVATTARTLEDVFVHHTGRPYEEPAADATTKGARP